MCSYPFLLETALTVRQERPQIQKAEGLGVTRNLGPFSAVHIDSVALLAFRGPGGKILQLHTLVKQRYAAQGRIGGLSWLRLEPKKLLNRVR